MSLINDALKRAKHAQKGPPTLPRAEAPLKPVEAQPAQTSEFPVLLVFGVLIVLGIGALVVTFVVYKRSQMVFTQGSAPQQPIVAPVTPGSAQNPTSAQKPQSVAAPMPATTASPVVAAAAPLAKTALPKLQGIFFSPSRPSAVVDGKTVFVGDMVGDFDVITIKRDSVTVRSGGQNYSLALPQ